MLISSSAFPSEGPILLVLVSGFSGFPHQRSGCSRLRLLGQRAEDLPGRGARGVRARGGSALRGVLLLQPLHDLRRLPGGCAGPAGEA